MANLVQAIYKAFGNRTYFQMIKYEWLILVFSNYVLIDVGSQIIHTYKKNCCKTTYFTLIQ